VDQDVVGAAETEDDALGRKRTQREQQRIDRRSKAGPQAAGERRGGGADGRQWSGVGADSCAVRYAGAGLRGSIEAADGIAGGTRA
jgi:hypothetical protein